MSHLALEMKSLLHLLKLELSLNQQRANKKSKQEIVLNFIMVVSYSVQVFVYDQAHSFKSICLLSGVFNTYFEFL